MEVLPWSGAWEGEGGGGPQMSPPYGAGRAGVIRLSRHYFWIAGGRRGGAAIYTTILSPSTGHKKLAYSQFILSFIS